MFKYSDDAQTYVILSFNLFFNDVTSFLDDSLLTKIRHAKDYTRCYFGVVHKWCHANLENVFLPYPYRHT